MIIDKRIININSIIIVKVELIIQRNYIKLIKIISKGRIIKITTKTYCKINKKSK